MAYTRLLVFLAVLIPFVVYAEQIQLHNGQIIYGKIIDQYLEESPEGSIKLNVEGVERTYYRMYKIQAPDGTIYVFKDAEIKQVYNQPFISNPIAPPALPFNQYPIGQYTSSQGMMDGVMYAEQIGTGGHFVGGLAIGVFTGLIGTSIGYFVIGPQPMTQETYRIAESRGSDYSLGFKTGWSTKTKSRKRNAFLAGGIIGTTAFVVTMLSVSGN